MHRSCVPDWRNTRKAFTLASWFPPSHTIPSYADQILRFVGFDVWTINVPHCTTNTLPFTSCGSQYKAHLAAAWGATLLSGGGALSQGPDRIRRSAGPRASGHPPIRLQSRRSSGGQRLLCRGEGNLGRLVLLFGPVLLGGDVDVGSWWKLNKWFNSDALLSLGKSVVKIRKMLFSFYKCFL